MSKMGEELERKLDQNKYEMYQALENAFVNMTVILRTKLTATIQWYVDDTLREVKQVLDKIEGGTHGQTEAPQEDRLHPAPKREIP